MVQAQEIDHKLKISERAAATATAVKESAAVKGAAAFFGRVGSGVKQATNKVVESERVRNWTGRKSPEEEGGSDPPAAS